MTNKTVVRLVVGNIDLRITYDNSFAPFGCTVDNKVEWSGRQQVQTILHMTEFKNATSRVHRDYMQSMLSMNPQYVPTLSLELKPC